MSASVITTSSLLPQKAIEKDSNGDQYYYCKANRQPNNDWAHRLPSLLFSGSCDYVSGNFI